MSFRSRGLRGIVSFEQKVAKSSKPGLDAVEQEVRSWGGMFFTAETPRSLRDAEDRVLWEPF